MTWGLRGVTVGFGPTTALDDVDLAVEPGTIHVVIGPDGAGKTTLARVLVGLVSVDHGHVDVPDRRRLGYQPEAAGTWTDLSVAENLSFVATAHGLGRHAAARIDDLLALTSLATARDRLAGDLSGGMRQKLAVAMAMLHSPALLVLDEPTTGLDPVSRGDVWRLLARAAADGAAIVATTTYLDEAQRAGDVVVLDHGSVLVRGTAAQITASFPGRLRGGARRDAQRPSWRRGHTWRTWVRQDTDATSPGRAGEHDHDDGGQWLEPDLEDVVMAASVARRQGVR